MIKRTESIIDEVRACREKLAAEHGNDIDRIFEALRASEREHPERVVRRIKHVTYPIEPAYDVDTAPPDA